MTPQFVPPFSASPCVTPTPHAAHSHSQPAAPQGFTEPSTSQQGSASPPASRQLPQDTHPTSQPAQLYAPTLAYVPVSLVSRACYLSTPTLACVPVSLVSRACYLPTYGPFRDYHLASSAQNHCFCGGLTACLSERGLSNESDLIRTRELKCMGYGHQMFATHSEAVFLFCRSCGVGL